MWSIRTRSETWPENDNRDPLIPRLTSATRPSPSFLLCLLPISVDGAGLSLRIDQLDMRMKFVIGSARQRAALRIRAIRIFEYEGRRCIARQFQRQTVPWFFLQVRGKESDFFFDAVRRIANRIELNHFRALVAEKLKHANHDGWIGYRTGLLDPRFIDVTFPMSGEKVQAGNFGCRCGGWGIFRDASGALPEQCGGKHQIEDAELHGFSPVDL